MHYHEKLYSDRKLELYRNLNEFYLQNFLIQNRNEFTSIKKKKVAAFLFGIREH